MGDWAVALCSAYPLLPAELLGPAGGGFHRAHGGCPQPALLQGMEPIDGSAPWCAHICPQLSWVLALLQQHLGCPLGRRALGAGDLEAQAVPPPAQPHCVACLITYFLTSAQVPWT